MAISSYKADLYNSILKTELVKFTIFAVILLVILISIIIGFLMEIKKNKAKKRLYVELFLVIAVFVFIFSSLFTQIVLFSMDIRSKSYICYVGPANIRAERKIAWGGIPTGYTEYVISFKNDANTVELFSRKKPKIVGNVDKVYIEYSKHSEFLFNLTP